MATTQYTKLKDLIEELENELDVVDSPEHHAMIQTLKNDLQSLKEQTNKGNLTAMSEEEDNSPFLKASINFEESHPKLATALNDIAYLLNNIGI